MLVEHAPAGKRDASLPIAQRGVHVDVALPGEPCDNQAGVADDCPVLILDEGQLALGRFGEAPPGIEQHDLIGDVRFPQEAFYLEAEWTGIGDAPGLAELVQSERHHEEPRGARLERTPGDVLRPATTAPPFQRDIAASPTSDMITGGRHSAITFAACPNLPVFSILTSPFFSQWRRSDQTWSTPIVPSSHH